MERRRATAVAGAVTATLVAAAVAIGVNVGLFGLTGRADRVGSLRPVDVPGATPAPALDPIVDTSASGPSNGSTPVPDATAPDATAADGTAADSSAQDVTTPSPPRSENRGESGTDGEHRGAEADD